MGSGESTPLSISKKQPRPSPGDTRKGLTFTPVKSPEMKKVKVEVKVPGRLITESLFYGH